ncbi:MAG: hypothetical protein RDV41_13295 [Planctomycetota bacterium]|nr:hypothetical protein [Planctomycetota bacterium]
MVFWKRTFPLVIAFVMGIVMMVRYFVPHQRSEDLYTLMSDWLIIIAGFAFFIGMFNLLGAHFAKVRRGVPGWGYSTVVILAAAATIFLGLMRDIEYSISSLIGTEINFISSMGVWENIEGGSPFDWVYQYFQVPLSATVFSILAFFIVSAAYRTFRARSTEATILLITAMIVMIGRVPIGSLIWSGIPDFQEWIMAVPNLAAKRGILIGVCLGSVATSLRIIFGIERAYLGGAE